jgi:hypothetical protein
MRITTLSDRHVIYMNDLEAENLLNHLQAVVARRKQLIAVEPSMQSWGDHVLLASAQTPVRRSVSISLAVGGVE